jgi:LmbE family N-acetylglucosaminyl deacetylase
MIYGIRSRIPVAPAAVWIAGNPAPDHCVDVTGTFPRKLAALRAHERQTGHLTDLEARLRAAGRPGRPRVAVPQAGHAGLGDDRLAEAFQVLETA